jgi:tetratricopeptide (TPR) repeat protein
MTTIASLFRRALQHQQAGNRSAAEQTYREILRQDERQPDAWHLLGVVFGQHGDSAAGLECILQAITLEPSNPVYYGNAGVMYRSLGHADAAVASYRKALELKPDFADAHSNLANLLFDQGKLDQAFAHYQHALWHKENFAEAYLGVGNVMRRRGRTDEAIGFYQAAVRIKPDLADAHDALGHIYCAQGRQDEAIAAFREAVRIRPDAAALHYRLATLLQNREQYLAAIESFRAAIACDPHMPEAHCHLGVTLLNQGQVEEAIASYERALAARPDYAEAHCGLGVAQSRQLRFVEAAESFLRAVELQPDYVQALNNLACVMIHLGRVEEGLDCYERVLRLAPDSVEAHSDRSMVLLMQGKFTEGWLEYEWRWKRKEAGNAVYARPRWTGGSLVGRTILLHTEQGFGDTIHFVRYATMLKELGARVILECQPALANLMARRPAIDQVVLKGQHLPPCDTQAPLLSLPGIFNTSLDNMPPGPPYLSPDPQLVAEWEQRLAGDDGYRVGINWQGSPTHARDFARSFALEHFAALAAAGVRLYSLQVGPGREQLAGAGRAWSVTDLADHLRDFHDSAAVMMNLDLIVTCDSAVAHLAGALGRPVWVALPFSPDWRWLLERSDSPWYPSMRLFRQPSPDDWESVFAAMQEALSALLPAAKGAAV